MFRYKGIYLQNPRLRKRLRNVPITFTRNSIAYNNQGEQTPAHTPRLKHYLNGEYIDALLIEEGTSNVCPVNAARGTDTNSNTTNFVAYTGGEISSSTEWSKEGSRSLKTITPGVAKGEGNYVLLTGMDAGTHSGSMYVKAPLDSKIRLLLGGGNGYYTGTGLEQYCTVTGSLGATDRFYLITSSAVDAQAITMYEDMVQVEKKAYPTTWQIPGTERTAETVTIPTSTINPLSGSIEIEFYISPAIKSTSGEKYLIDITGADGYLRLYKANGSDVFKFDSNNGENTDSISTSVAPTLGGWYRAVITWGDTTNLYINGALIGTGENGYKPTTPSSFNLGSLHDGTLQCNTYIRNLMVHREELGASEVLRRDTNASNGKGYMAKNTTSFILSPTNGLRGYKLKN